MVVAVGDTATEPVVALTVPTPGEMLADVAFWITQLSVEVWPDVIAAGCAVNCTICACTGAAVVTRVVACAEMPSVLVTLSRNV